MTERLDELELEAWRLLLRVHRDVIRRLDEEMLEAHGLSLRAYEVLLVLAYASGRSMRMSELAEEVLLSRSGVTRVVDGLAARGFVTRRRCPTDARGQLAVLTGAGLEQLRAAAGSHLSGVRRNFTGRLDDDDLARLAAILERVLGRELSKPPASLASAPR